MKGPATPEEEIFRQLADSIGAVPRREGKRDHKRGLRLRLRDQHNREVSATVH